MIVGDELEEARDQVHLALLELEHLVPDLVNDLLQVDDLDDLDNLRSAFDRLSERVRREINRLADNLATPEQEELAL
jgi:hypothetical protein